MIIASISSIRTSDAAAYSESGLKSQIEGVYVNGDPNRPLMFGGDQAHGQGEHSRPKRRNASLATMTVALRKAAEQEDAGELAV